MTKKIKTILCTVKPCYISGSLEWKRNLVIDCADLKRSASLVIRVDGAESEKSGSLAIDWGIVRTERKSCNRWSRVRKEQKSLNRIGQS